jgi:hypothetical protein
MNENDELKKTSKYPKELVDKLFFEFDETEMIVIKVHLFIENSLDKFITACNHSITDIEKMNFTFNHKINIAKILGLFQNNQCLETYIIDLNRLRNQIAHKHTYDSDLYDKIVNYPADFKNQVKWKTKDAFKIGVMAIKSGWMYGFVQGKIDKIKESKLSTTTNDDKVADTK